jgi:hypothetical protein
MPTDMDGGSVLHVAFTMQWIPCFTFLCWDSTSGPESRVKSLEKLIDKRKMNRRGFFLGVPYDRNPHLKSASRAPAFLVCSGLLFDCFRLRGSFLDYFSRSSLYTGHSMWIGVLLMGHACLPRTCPSRHIPSDDNACSCKGHCHVVRTCRRPIRLADLDHFDSLRIQVAIWSTSVGFRLIDPHDAQIQGLELITGVRRSCSGTQLSVLGGKPFA